MGARLGVELTVALALLAGLLFFYVQTARLETELAQAGKTIATRDVLIANQNRKTDDLAAKAQLLEAEATAAAHAALLAGERRRAALPAGHGPGVMNAWMRETFGGAP